MNGSVVLVTGAASEIGRVAELFSDYGARVVAADRSESAAETADAGGKAIAVQADLSVESDVERMVAAAVGTPGALNAAFNNAGHRAACRPVRTTQQRRLRAVSSVHLRGVWLCMKHEPAVMARQGHSAIVNTCRSAVWRPRSAGAAYSAVNHGVVGLTRCIAAEHGRHGIRVHAIGPGLTRTGRLRHMEEHEHLDAAGVRRSRVLARFPAGQCRHR